MKRRSTRPLVVMVCWVLRCSKAARTGFRRVASRARSPARHVLLTALSPVRRGAQLLVREIGGQGPGAVLLTVCVVVASAGTAGLAVVKSYTGAGTGELLDVAAALAVGALAVGAAVWLLRVHARQRPALELRVLTTSVLDRLDACHQHGPALHALRVACDPRRLWPSRELLLRGAEELGQRGLKSLVKRPLRCLPMLGSALELASVCQSTLDSGRFVQQFAFTALQLLDEAA